MRRAIACLILALQWLTAGETATLRLPQVLSDGMVVQRDQPVQLWGWDRPGQAITVGIAPGGLSGAVSTGEDGRWRCELPALHAEGPYTITVQGSGKVVISDVLAGEVWLCAGQSNMHWSVAKSTGGEADISAAGDPKLRLLMTPTDYQDTPLEDVAVRWNRATPVSVRNFSGVAYHFGRSLRRELKVPVGIIQSAVGGSTAEAWIDRDWLRGHAEGGARFSIGLYDANFTPAKLAPYWTAYAESTIRWAESLKRNDMGQAKETAEWSEPGCAEAGWSDCAFPALYGDKKVLGGSGAVWFRRTIDLPASMQGQDLSVYLGAIQQCDGCWWNGQRIGGTGWEVPYGPGSFRTYTVPAAQAKARNVLAIRVWSGDNQGGFTTDAEWTRIEPRRWTGESVPLAGTWRMKAERLLPPFPADAPARPAHTKEYLGHQKTAGKLWDAMVAPYSRLRLAGVAWYQGESNSWLPNHVMFHYDVLPVLIAGWRSAFARDDLPFHIVQLPGSSTKTWPEFRNSQAAALRLPSTGLVVTLDVGDPKEIHCPDKRPVGERLTSLAMQQVYGLAKTGRCPLLEDATREEAGTVRCRLRDAAGLQVRGGGAVAGVEVAGVDGVWVKAIARIDGEALVVRSDGVTEPTGVRYAWVAWPDFPLLENGVGLPVGPFRRHLAAPRAVSVDGKRPDRPEVKFELCDRLRQPAMKGTPPGFALAGADGVWKPATLVMVASSSVTLSAKDVPEPRQVRYQPPADEAQVPHTADGFALTAFSLPCGVPIQP
jgi:sialate O-acetylesterase